MPKLIYSGILSLDGYIADEKGDFDWARPDREVHTFINELERPIGSYLYGRRMYEIMAVWETMGEGPDMPPFILDYAKIWRGADKYVYSKTLVTVSTARTSLHRDFDPEAVRKLKASSGSDLGIGGPTLAAPAIKAGLVDEYQLFLTPVLVGGGLSFFPPGAELKLELVDQRRFGNGMVYLKYKALEG